MSGLSVYTQGAAPGAYRGTIFKQLVPEYRNYGGTTETTLCLYRSLATAAFTRIARTADIIVTTQRTSGGIIPCDGPHSKRPIILIIETAKSRNSQNREPAFAFSWSAPTKTLLSLISTWLAQKSLLQILVKASMSCATQFVYGKESRRL
jgi:hypothetical protein